MSSAIRTTFRTEPRVQYGWLPPAQTVGGGRNPNIEVPSGYIHQTAFTDGGGPDIQGVYTAPAGDWAPVVWRWADTNRADSIRCVTRTSTVRPGGFPAYRIEVEPDDESSPGTVLGRPRAELFSVDPGEKRGDRRPPDGSVVRDGEEYWCTFAVYITKAFPTNHRWATLFQRKMPDNTAPDWQRSWLTVNVHGDTLDVSLPGTASDTYTPVTTLAEVTGKWVRFTLHEVLSSGSAGLVEVYVNKDRAVIRPLAETVPAGDLGFHFQYGYYRTNEPARGQSAGPGEGVLYYTPLLIHRVR